MPNEQRHYSNELNLESVGTVSYTHLKAVKENLEYILPSLEHGVRIAAGLDGECARK